MPDQATPPRAPQQDPAGQATAFALTGGIGSGKSSVARLFAASGVPVVDADAVARLVVAPGTPGLAQIEAEFGPEVLLADGSLDRPALGRIVFAEPDARQRLNTIVHPLVRAEVQRQIEAHFATGQQLVCYDIPLLFETGQESRFRPVVVVDVAEAERVARVAQRDGLSPDEVRARIAAQLPLAEKVRRADIVIDNNAGAAELKAEAERALQAVRAWLEHPPA